MHHLCIGTTMRPSSLDKEVCKKSVIFRLWHEAKVPERTGYFWSWGWTGCAISLPAMAALDPHRTSGDQWPINRKLHFVMTNPLSAASACHLTCEIGAGSNWACTSDENASSQSRQRTVRAEPPLIVQISVTVCRPTIDLVEYTMRSVVVWHGRRRPRRRFFRISVL